MRNFIFQAFETEGHNGFCNAKGFRQFPFEMHKVLPGLQLRESLFDAGQKEARGEQKLGSPFVRLPFQEALKTVKGLCRTVAVERDMDQLMAAGEIVLAPGKVPVEQDNIRPAICGEAGNPL